MTKSAGKAIEAKRWFIRGRVQGVGYRYFAQRAAAELGLTGYTRNLEYCGPRQGEVHGTEEQEAAVHKYGSLRIA